MAITPKDYSKILYYGTQANYNAIAEKDSSILYFCTDTKKIYKGTIDFTDSVVFAAEKPQTPIVGKLYILSGTGTAEVYNGSAWSVVSYPRVTTIDANSDDNHIASALAVKTYVDAATGSTNVVKNVANKANTEATLVITKGDDTTTDLVLAGVVTTPSYNATSRTFTFPVSDGNDVVVELGKDIFIDPEGDNSYHPDTKEIWLTLNDGSATSDPTVIKIPADGLVNIISTEDTTSVDLTYNTSTGVMSAAVILKPNSQETGAEFTNSLQLANDGLYVDLSGYYTAAEVDALIGALDTRLDAAEDAIDLLNAASTVTGSVAYQIAQSEATLTPLISAAQAKADQNEADIAALATAATQWGTF
jgi:hypothetical protein